MENTAIEFVKYLNTLHRCGGNNRNSTAESNYNQSFAHDILYNDEDLINKIENDLFKGSGKMLLTGFAGDGKTTLAQLIVERLTGGSKLIQSKQEFFIEKYNKVLVVIKDLSEYKIEDNEELIINYLLNEKYSLLIVSNTGAILYRMKEAYKLLGYDNKDGIEKEILKGISTNNNTGYGEISLPKVLINVVNLVKHDNLPSSMKILEKIVNHESWNNIDSKVDLNHPILLNIKALKNESVRERLFLMYQCLFEYGNRFTLRNFVEHFSYLITGNLELSDTVNNPDDFFFYNNIFGCFEKSNNNLTCNEIFVIKNIKSKYFGGNISPKWKRRIWNKTNLEIQNNILKPFNEYFLKYKDIGYKYTSNIERIKLYRLVYFLLPEKLIDDDYYKSFLNSPGLVLWKKIQGDINSLSSNDKFDLFNNLRHTIKEYFAGLKLPTNETGPNKDTVYVTMSRKKNIRQSAQVVLGQFNWENDKKVKIDVFKDFRGISQFRLLMMKESSNKYFFNSDWTDDDCIVLELPLPFLDYLLYANGGSIFDDNYQYFQKRLDSFKNEIISSQINSKQLTTNNLLLVRLKPDRNLGDINFELVNNNNNKILEVH